MSHLFPNAWHVARREYLARVRGRTFLFSTVLLMLLTAGVVLLPSLLGALGVDDPASIAVSIEAEDLPSDPILALETMLGAGGGEMDPPGAVGPGGATADVTRTDNATAAAESVREGQLDGLLTIMRGAAGDLTFDYLSDDGPTSRTRLLVQQAATTLAINDRLVRAGIDPADQGQLFAPPDFEAVPADPNAREPEDLGPSLLLAYAVVVLTFLAILTYGTWVAQSVAEEKSNRVMELLVTAATPRQLLTGKVLGTCAAGLTQYVAILLAVGVGLLLGEPLGRLLGAGAAGGVALPALTVPTIAGFVAFFLGGFVLYSTLYAAAGSMVSRIEEVQQAAGPLMVVAMVGYLAAFAGLNAPDERWVAILSLVPFFSAYLMPARMLLTTPSSGEVMLALGLLAITIVLAIWLAARIYSAGVLLYGQRPGWRQVLRAARVSR